MSQNNESKVSTGASVLAEVASALQGSAPQVRGRLVSVLTERELAKRVDLLDKALTKRASLQSELDSIRMPTKKVFHLVDGKMVEAQVTLTYTPEEAKKYAEDLKAHNKKVKEATEKLAKFDKVLEAAFTGDENDPEALAKAFAKLGQLVAGKEQPAAESSEQSE